MCFYLALFNLVALAARVSFDMFNCHDRRYRGARAILANTPIVRVGA